MTRCLILALAFACAHQPPPPIPAAMEAIESPDHLLGRLLCDACTSSPTDEECIAHAAFILERCHGSQSHCFRKACVKLSDTEPGSFTPAMAVLPAVLITCQFGGVHRGDGAIATGNNCVLHDAHGATTAQALVVYDRLRLAGP